MESWLTDDAFSIIAFYHGLIHGMSYNRKVLRLKLHILLLQVYFHISIKKPRKSTYKTEERKKGMKEVKLIQWEKVLQVMYLEMASFASRESTITPSKLQEKISIIDQCELMFPQSNYILMRTMKYFSHW